MFSTPFDRSHLIGEAYLPIILRGSWHQQKTSMTQRNPNPLHVSVVTILLLRENKHTEIQNHPIAISLLVPNTSHTVLLDPPSSLKPSLCPDLLSVLFSSGRSSSTGCKRLHWILPWTGFDANDQKNDTSFSLNVNPNRTSQPWGTRSPFLRTTSPN